MLKKINRGLKKKDFEKSLAQGRLVQSPLFAMSVIKSEGDKNKFGFIVSRKISKLAVQRNKIRRLLAEAVRENMDRVGKSVHLIIFLARRSLLDKKYNEVSMEVKKALSRINEENST